MIRKHALYDFSPFTFYQDLFHGLVHGLSRLPWWLSGKESCSKEDTAQPKKPQNILKTK